MSLGFQTRNQRSSPGRRATSEFENAGEKHAHGMQARDPGPETLAAMEPGRDFVSRHQVSQPVTTPVHDHRMCVLCRNGTGADAQTVAASHARPKKFHGSIAAKDRAAQATLTLEGHVLRVGNGWQYGFQQRDHARNRWRTVERNISPCDWRTASCGGKFARRNASA